MGAHEVDAAAVQQDAAIIHALATRALDEVDVRDPAVAVLAVWIADVDAGSDHITPFEMPTPSQRSSADVVPLRRGRRSALVAGSTVLALVVSGGAAAAVTGDPMAIVRAPLHALGKVNPFADSEPNARDRLPEPAPATADANKLLADAQRAMANGNTDKAQELLAEAKALLGENVNPGQQNRIDKLQGDLPGQSGSQQGPKGQGPGDKPDQGPKGQGPADKPDQEPKGQGPADKPDQEPKGEGSGDKPDQEPKGEGSGDKSTGTKPETGQSTNDPDTNAGGPGKQSSDKAEDPGSTKPSRPSSSGPKA